MPQCNETKDLGELTQTAANLARDAAYVVVGMGVLAVQRAQVQRVAVTERLGRDFKPGDLKAKLGERGLGDLKVQMPADLDLSERIERATRALTEQLRHLDDLVERAAHFVETSLQPLEDQLPDPARDLAKRARRQVHGVRTQIRDRVTPAA